MREEEIFHQALDQPEDRRESFLDAACEGDSDLRQRVEVLLRAHENPGSFLQSPAHALPTLDQPLAEKPGAQIGPYKLLQEIGQGGMGVVYMAEQSEPVKRRVALKIIKPGMDTLQVIARFEAERQALSLMDHPNIAKVLDAGATESGRPYFVMELVKGQPITQYCDEHHLTPRQRLELLLPVCQAIQHAHQKGIIHRDIKPTNILVAEYDQQPVPKVIDFGVAKATSQTLTEKTMFTGFGQIVGTLEYMSPEQAKVNQLDIDTRSDIYSLGVLLYELLTGSTPFDKQRLRSAAFDEMLRIIREEEPPKPSTRLSDLCSPHAPRAGMSSSHSVSAESSGTRASSRSEPATLASIAALRQTEPAKLTKLVRGELDWIVMKALEKDRSRRYETASGFAADVQRYLDDEPVQACPPSAGYRLRKFVRRNKGRLVAAGVLAAGMLIAVAGIGWAIRDRSARDAQAAQEKLERQARLVAQADVILEDVQHWMREQNWNEALISAKRAEALLAGGEPDDATRAKVAGIVRDLEFVARLEQIRQEFTLRVGFKLYFGNDAQYATAFREFGVDVETLTTDEAASALRSHAAISHPIAEALDTWARVRRYAGGNPSRTWPALVALANRLDPDPVRQQIRSLLGFGKSSEDQTKIRRLVESTDIRGQPPSTVTLLAAHLKENANLELAEKILRDGQYEHPGDFWVNFSLGGLLSSRHNDLEATQFLRAAAALQPTYMITHANLGISLDRQGKHEEAIACFHKAIQVDPRHGYVINLLGATLHKQGKLDEAIACFHKVIELDPTFPYVYVNLGLTLKTQKKPDEAIASYRKAIELDPKHAQAYNNLAWLLATATDEKLRNPPNAIELARKAVELTSQGDGSFWNTLGVAYYRAGDVKAAIEALEKAEKLIPGNGLAFNGFFLSMAYWQLGDKERARKFYDQALQSMGQSNPQDGELRRFRDEAAQLLGLSTGDKK